MNAAGFTLLGLGSFGVACLVFTVTDRVVLWMQRRYGPLERDRW